MPLTVLFDLDDTLLFTNMDLFLPRYFDLLGQTLNHLGSQETIIYQIQFAVQKMVANNDPGKTLKEVFDDHFYGPLGTTEEACREILAAFYRDEYPCLQPITQPKPEATDLVNRCLSEGMTVAIATNPLFPQTATRQRIEWAGLDPNKFAFFSAFNDFHFTKPNLAYYAEVLGRLGWPKKPAVMIGDSLTYDLLPMQIMGFDTFWINPHNQNPNQPSGTISDVNNWLTKDRYNHKALNDDLEVNVAILQSTPAVLDSWLRYPPSNQLPKRSTKQIRLLSNTLKKLAATETEIFQPYLKKSQKRMPVPKPSLDNANKDTWVNEPDDNPHELFLRFLSARQVSLGMLNDIRKNPPFFDSAKSNNKSNGLKALIGVMSEHDRDQLHDYVSMLNVYKIY